MKQKPIQRDGHFVQVIRPEDPEHALRVVKECLETQNVARLAKLPTEVGKYRLLGYASPDGTVVNKTGKYLDKMQPGDSFVAELIGVGIGDRVLFDMSN